MASRRPTFCEGDFRKSTRSDPQQSCVEVAQRAGWAEVRDSKTAFGSPIDRRLTFSAQQFTSFLTCIGGAK